MDDLISRQAVIDTLNIDAELLKRALDDIYVVGAERAEYEWGLGLIESCISDVKELPSVQSAITCDGCRFVGTYDTDFPCCSCIRREKDYYEPER